MHNLVRTSVSRSLRLLKSHNQLKILSTSSLGDVVYKVFDEMPGTGYSLGISNFSLEGRRRVHCAPWLSTEHKAAAAAVPPEHLDKGKANNDAAGNAKVKRKKLKGKRAVVKWLKQFRYKKKKAFERMTAEEKILHKLRKAQKKEERLLVALKKIEPSEISETSHDPEILTPEEHFFFLKMGLKCKNYVPVGRRGIYQGVILNMHLHWKKHQTLQVIVKTFSAEEVKEIASELARLTGGIVLGIHEENTIIMYRGKNYSQPPTEIMSPRVTLSRKKALDQSKYKDGLRAVRKYIPKLEQDLDLLRSQAKRKVEFKSYAIDETPETEGDSVESRNSSNIKLEPSEKLKEIIERTKECSEDDFVTDGDMPSEDEDLSDIFDTDSDKESENKAQRPLYLEEFEKFPVESDGEPEDFEDHLRQISMDSKKSKSLSEDAGLPNFDEVDRIFLQAASLLKKKRR